MKRTNTLLVIAVLGFTASPAANSADVEVEDVAPARRIIPYEVIVQFKPDTQVAALHSRLGDVVLTRSTADPDLALVRIDVDPARHGDESFARTQTEAFAEELRHRDDVIRTQVNSLLRFAYTPNDPLFPEQWNLPMISVPSAWNLTMGSPSIKIAILDTGRTSHPDLTGRWTLPEYYPYDELLPAVDNGDWRHGTHVAAIAGAATDNGIGTAGICGHCGLMNAKVSMDDPEWGGASMWAIVQSIPWVVANGARVINMSFEEGVPCSVSGHAVLRHRIEEAIARGVVVVAAAGNWTQNVVNVTPASCPGVISVAAVNEQGQLSLYSSRGPTISISAPGGGGEIFLVDENGQPSKEGEIAPWSTIYGSAIVSPPCPRDPDSFFNFHEFGITSAWTTTEPTGNAHCYRRMSGTSMAAPHVSGVAGLMLSVNSYLRPHQIQTIMANTATPVFGCGNNCGPGLLNAYAAVQAAQNTKTGPCSARPSGASQCTIDNIGQTVDAFGQTREWITAYGYLWELFQGTQTGIAKKLHTIERYTGVSGPCVYTPAGQECRFDSLTTVDYPDFGFLETITAYGRYWNFDVNGNGLGGNGSLLTTVPRYANGPCLHATGTCQFDTRDLVNAPEWGGGGLYETVTAYGRYWIFNVNGNLLESNLLTDVPRYASGPCAYRPTGTLCTFDSREQRRTPYNGVHEVITAYGRYFEWDGSGNPAPQHGLLLTQVARLQ